VAVAKPKHLALILAREFATSLATPMLVADERGVLVFYNDAVAEIVGRPFAEAGEAPLDDWMAQFGPRPLEPDPSDDERRPTQIAFEDRQAAHRRFRVTSVDGVERQVALTAFPLFAHADEFVGVVAIFWRE
jgi:PAS domain-containing protein